MTTPILPDDRRHLTTRLTVLQGWSPARSSLLAVGFWVFQVAQREKFEVMAENNHSRRLQLPAPRGVLFDRNLKVLVENQNTFNITLDREQAKGNLDDTLHAAGDGHRRRRGGAQGDRQPQAARAELPADRADRERDARAGDGRAAAALRAARDHLSGSAGPEIPVERPRGPPLRLCQRNQRGPADARRIHGRRAGHDGRPGRRRAGLQQAADGRRRRQVRRRQQRRPRDPRGPGTATQGGRAPAADHRRRRAAGDRGRLHAVGLQRRGGRARPAATAKCSASSAGRPTIPTPSPAASIAPRGRRSTPTI